MDKNIENVQKNDKFLIKIKKIKKIKKIEKINDFYKKIILI